MLLVEKTGSPAKKRFQPDMTLRDCLNFPHINLF